MALRRMPNGAYVNVPDDITPAGLAKITARYAGKPAASRSVAAPSGMSKRDQENETHIRDIMSRQPDTGAFGAFTDNAAHALTLGADEVVGPAMLAGTEGLVRAMRRGDIGEIGRTYSNARTAGQRRRAAQSEKHGLAGGAGTVAGIIANPIGAETGLARSVAATGRTLKKFAPVTAGAVDKAGRTVAAIKASKAGRMIEKAGTGMIGTGARAGFNQGFATGLMDTGNVEDALNEGGTGALFGGAASALLRGGQAVARTVGNQAPENANRVAMERIAAMLDRSEDPLTKKPFDAGAVQREIRATDAAGGDAMLADLTPEGQGWASYLAKQPGNKGASAVINRAEDRAAGAADRFEARVRKQLNLDKNAPDAYDTVKGITADRKAAAARDYSDDVMNRQLAWSDNLDKFFKKNNPVVRDALDRAERLIRSEDGDVTQLAFSKMNDPTNSTMTQVPSMGVLDKIKKGFDSKIGEALKSGDRETARMYSMQLRLMKDEVAKVNPEYGTALANQRDFFERQNSVELGTEILKKLRAGKAREVLDEIKAGSVKPDDLKVGFADALMKLRETNENPVALMRRFMRSDAQRKVLSHVFGGNKNLNDFERFMRRELRGSHTDSMVSSGRQMQANLLRDQPPGGDVETFGDIGKAGLQGAAFGGPMGAVSRMISSTGKWSQFLSAPAKAELSRLLSGKGEGLEEGLKKLRREALKNKARMRKAATATGKAPSAVVGGYSEQ